MCVVVFAKRKLVISQQNKARLIVFTTSILNWTVVDQQGHTVLWVQEGSVVRRRELIHVRSSRTTGKSRNLKEFSFRDRSTTSVTVLLYQYP